MRAGSLLLALALAVLPAAGVVAAQPQLTRTQALKALGDASAEKRRAAIERLADVGVMADSKALVDELRDPDEEARSGAEDALWRIWSRSGDAKVDALYQQGVLQMSTGESEGAIATFSRIIQMRPAFAEAWNKRATVYFLVGDFEKSLADCDEVMKRNPHHFGALAGYFQIYVLLEDYERAVRYGRRALQVNPNMEGVKQGIEALERKLHMNRQVI